MAPYWVSGIIRLSNIALVVELVDTLVLEASDASHESSSLSWGTKVWRRGRVAEGTSLLTKQTERFREFESHRLRHIIE